ESLLYGAAHIQARGLDGLASQPRERQKVVDQLAHFLAVVANDLQQSAALVVEPVPIVFLEDSGEAVYGSQRRTQVVGHRVAEALQLLIGGLELVGPHLQ